MKEFTAQFVKTLKLLSIKYNFKTTLDFKLSSTTVEYSTYYTEFHIKTEAEKFTTQDFIDLRLDIEKLLRKTQFSKDLYYNFYIKAKNDEIMKIYEEEFFSDYRDFDAEIINFGDDDIDEVDYQRYKVRIENGLVTLKKDHDNSEEFFRSNPDIIEYLKTFLEIKEESNDKKPIRTKIASHYVEENFIQSVRENITDEDLIEIKEMFKNNN